MKSATSSSSKAFPSESIGTAWRTLPNASTGAAPTRSEGLSDRCKAGKRASMAALRARKLVVFGIADFGFVLPVVERIVPGDLGGQAFQLGLCFRAR